MAAEAPLQALPEPPAVVAAAVVAALLAFPVRQVRRPPLVVEAAGQ